LFTDPTLEPEASAQAYVNADKGVADAAAALEGARQILMERFAEDPELTGRMREFAWDNGRLQSKLREGKEEEGAKFADYFDAIEPVRKVPSHRALAMFRGQTEEVLTLSLVIDELDDEGKPKSEISVGELMI